jgi:hypothetical protein
MLIGLALGVVTGRRFPKQNKSAQSDCKIEAMNRLGTIVVRLDQPAPCDPAAMAIEAGTAVKAATEESQ